MKPIEILLVEDNPGDVRLTKEALREADVCSNLNVAKDGVEAIDFLFKAKGYELAPLPDIVFLDLNLPRRNGHEVLKKMKAHESLRSIPVVILTTSRADRDVTASYGNYANCYISKPVDFDSFIEVIRSIERFWFKVVRLPSRDAKSRE